jgi:hypothetical protein
MGSLHRQAQRAVLAAAEWRATHALFCEHINEACESLTALTLLRETTVSWPCRAGAALRELETLDCALAGAEKEARS